jgi:hypothetical protein
MRERQPFAAQLDLAEQEQVEVDRPRAVAGTGEGAPVFDLDRLADVEQPLGAERGSHPGGGVEEVRLVEDLSHRLRFIEGGDRLDPNPLSAEVLERATEVSLAIPDVRAEPDVADPLSPARALAQIPCSSPGSRSIEPSRVTSTPASSTV